MYDGSTGVERLEKEYREIKKKKGLNQIGGSAGIINKDYKHWRACFIGPQGTPYENGLYYIEFKLKDDYPTSRPLARFRTKIWHPNVSSSSGTICLDYIKGNWSPNNTLREAILSIFSLLAFPNFSDALNSDAKGSEYEKTAREYNGKYALQSQEYNWMENYENWS
jgi:ubiquitin-protein ligase